MRQACGPPRLCRPVYSVQSHSATAAAAQALRHLYPGRACLGPGISMPTSCIGASCSQQRDRNAMRSPRGAPTLRSRGLPGTVPAGTSARGSCNLARVGKRRTRSLAGHANCPGSARAGHMPALWHPSCSHARSCCACRARHELTAPTWVRASRTGTTTAPNQGVLAPTRPACNP